jgi:hypothetical protein
VNCTADVHDRAVHATRGVGEDAQPGHLRRQLGRGVGAVAGARGDQDEQPAADTRDALAADLDGGLADALDQRSHGGPGFLIGIGRVLH